MFVICSKLTVKTTEQWYWLRSGVFIVILKRFYWRPSGAFIVDFILDIVELSVYQCDNFIRKEEVS